MSTPSSPPQPLTYLDILGIGLSIEMFPQSLAWDEMQLYESGSIFQTALTKFGARSDPDSAVVKRRTADALAACVKDFVHDWPIPTVCILPQRPAADSLLSANVVDGAGGRDAIESWIGNLCAASELPSHRLAYLGSYFDKEPEHIFERAFQFLDAHRDVPALLICVADGDVMRKLLGDVNHQPGIPGATHRFDSLVESAVFLLVGRKERSQMLRYFAGTPATHLYAPGPQRPGFKPSKFLPGLWNHDQLDQFDNTPVVARIGRPVRISYAKQVADESGEESVVLMHDQERFDVFGNAFKSFVGSIEPGKTSRIFFDNGGPKTGRHVVPLALAVEAVLPEFDLFDYQRGFDMYQRVGNLGAAGPYVQWVLAAYAACENGDTSLAVNLRQKTEATLTAVSANPVAEAKADAPGEAGRASSVPGSAAVPAVAVQKPVPVRNHAPSVPLGTVSSSGEECPQGGMWKCEPPDAEYGATHYIPTGRSFPPVTVVRVLTAMQKLRGEAAKEKVRAKWQLVSYEMKGQ
jgi:hypothetical protein